MHRGNAQAGYLYEKFHSVGISTGAQTCWKGALSGAGVPKFLARTVSFSGNRFGLLLLQALRRCRMLGN